MNGSKIKNILIYYDEGVSFTSKQAALKAMAELFDGIYEIKEVDRHYVNNSNWGKNAVLFVMPGGSTKPHYKNLANGGNQKILNFVQSGGKYLGLCAGGYYGCAKTEFDPGLPLEVKVNGPLNFFQGIAFGPAYGLGKYVYNSEQGARAALVNWPGDTSRVSHIYFNGGCYFIGVDQNSHLTVLSKFLDIPGSPPAILLCKVGRGAAILSGVHFEFDPQLIDRTTLPDLGILQTLESVEHERIDFLKDVIKYFGLNY